MIFEPMVRLAQTVHLSCTKTNNVSTSSIGCVKNNSRALWYVRRKPFTYLASRLAQSPNEPNEHPREPRQLGVLSGVSKMIFEPMVRLAQTVRLCTDTNTISKWTEASHKTHVT
jgi:hypothetical protein